MMCGGFTEFRPMEDSAKEIAMSIKPQIETILNATYTVYEPLKFKTQVVAGTNYVFQIKVDGNKMIEVKVFKPLPNNGTELEIKDLKMK